MRAPSSVGGMTLGSYVPHMHVSTHEYRSPKETFSRMAVGRLLMRLRKNGVIFRSYYGYVKATDLKTGDVSYGRDNLSAAQAYLAMRNMKAINRRVVLRERERVFAEWNERLFNRRKIELLRHWLTAREKHGL